MTYVLPPVVQQGNITENELAWVVFLRLVLNPCAGTPQPLHRGKDVNVEVNVEVKVTPKKGKVRACEVKVAGA